MTASEQPVVPIHVGDAIGLHAQDVIWGVRPFVGLMFAAIVFWRGR